MSKKLLPCPFCGGQPYQTPAHLTENYRLAMSLEETSHYQCRCQHCSAAGGIRNTPEKAIAAWNRRTQPENKEGVNKAQCSEYVTI